MLTLPRAAALATCLLAIAAPAASGEAFFQFQADVKWADSDGTAVKNQVRPTHFSIHDPGVGFEAHHLRWKHWGSATATATGRMLVAINMTPHTLRGPAELRARSLVTEPCNPDDPASSTAQRYTDLEFRFTESKKAHDRAWQPMNVVPEQASAPVDLCPISPTTPAP